MREYIINYISGAVLTDLQFTDQRQYKIRRENLKGAIDQLIEDGKITPSIEDNI